MKNVPITEGHEPEPRNVFDDFERVMALLAFLVLVPLGVYVLFVDPHLPETAIDLGSKQDYLDIHSGMLCPYPLRDMQWDSNTYDLRGVYAEKNGGWSRLYCKESDCCLLMVHPSDDCNFGKDNCTLG